MSETTKPNPVTPYLSVRNGIEAISFYEQAFGAEEAERYEFEGKLGHAALRINGGVIFMADEFPEHEAMTGNVAPPTLGDRTTFTISLQVDDADAWPFPERRRFVEMTLSSIASRRCAAAATDTASSAAAHRSHGLQ